MSNTRDNGPELDYYELRRRHEQYKSRARKPVQPAEAAKPVEATRPVEPTPAEPIETQRPAEQADAPKPPRREDRVRPAEDFVPEEAFDDSAAMDEEIPADDEAEFPEDEYENPNPFDSFIRFFHGVKDNISARRSAKHADEEVELEDALDEDGDPAEEAPAKRIFGRKRPEPDFDEAEFDDLDGEAEDIDGVEVDGQPLRSAPVKDGADLDEFDDEEFDDGEFEDEAPRGGFKKFLNLFVTRVDEEDEEADEDEDEAGLDFDDEDAPELNEIPAARPEPARRKPRDIEGGQVEMDDMNKPTIDALQEQMAAELETSGMSRRERRERAMRLAAEEAAKAAAAAPAPEAAPVQESAPAQEAVPSVFEEKPAAPELREEIVEEPTREFKPVSMRDVAPASDEKLFDLDDDEDEEEEEVKKPRRGLFGRKKSRKYEDEDDEDEDDDYDDDADDYDEDDEDEEEDERPARRGLFGRRKSVDDEDEDDEDDEDDYDDDEDDEDEDDYDDEYDEYDDDDEDEDDDDDEYDEDEDEHRSFGHHVIGVLKSILGIIIFLLVVVIVLNFVPAFNGVVDTLNSKFGDSKAFHFMFPGYIARQTLDVHEEPEVTVEPTIEPIDVTDVSASSVLPDLSQDAADGQAASADGATTDAATIG